MRPKVGGILLLSEIYTKGCYVYEEEESESASGRSESSKDGCGGGDDTIFSQHHSITAGENAKSAAEEFT